MGPRLLLVLAAAALSLPVRAEIVEEPLAYTDGDDELTGSIYYDDSLQGRRPGVLVLHEWWGLNAYARRRARMLAELGYVALAADMYGAGRVTRHPEDAQTWMSQITARTEAWRRRAARGLAALRDHQRTDPARLAAVGYCFGGATAMQLAYGGADLRGAVSFHGSLPVADPEDARAVRAQVLVAHGGADAFIPKERPAAFRQALEDAGVAVRFDVYPGARHGFTNPDAGEYGVDGLAYDAEADRKSWNRMRAFLAEVFGD